MFAPIGSRPIASIATLADEYASASGGLGLAGGAGGVVRVAGASGGTLSLFGAASTSGASVNRGSRLGFGPISSGSIGEAPSIVTTAAPGILGVSSGVFSFGGVSSGAVLIKGYAPDIVLAAWSITAGNASGTINSFPLPPVDPDWSISVGNPGFTILSYPSYLGAVPGIPFFGMNGSATIGTPLIATSLGAMSFAGAAAASVTAGLSASSAFNLDGAAASRLAVRSATTDVFTLAGAAVARYGIFPLSGTASDDFDLSGAGTISVGHNARAQGDFLMLGVSASGAPRTAQAASIFELFGGAEIGQLSAQRIAFPHQSRNNGRILSEQEAAKLLSR